MTYTPLRKDLTETSEKCNFCSKHLRSLKVYVLKNIKTGAIVFSGPECARRNLAEGFSLKGIPDLTKYTSAAGLRSGGGTGGGRNYSTESSDEKRAIEYLELRERKLANEINCSWDVLSNLYKAYLDGNLTEQNVRLINNIEKKAPDVLKLDSLQKCYNYLFWIDVGIEKLDEDKKQFLKSIRNIVRARKQLTPKQFEAMNKWLGNIDGVPQLK
ncbi:MULTISPECIES: hypothetical protein [Aeromonas]|uniref:hypothetical protein n=1 Tax=Aeromonas TaxID=642 RepID=UPI000A49B8B9|nr:hypothetical protein [Aeromonas hydrophila]QWL79654.1 hypothetical protein HQ395_13260 [Aeromonas hydrophila]